MDGAKIPRVLRVMPDRQKNFIRAPAQPLLHLPIYREKVRTMNTALAQQHRIILQSLRGMCRTVRWRGAIVSCASRRSANGSKRNTIVTLPIEPAVVDVVLEPYLPSWGRLSRRHRQMVGARRTCTGLTLDWHRFVTRRRSIF